MHLLVDTEQPYFWYDVASVFHKGPIHGDIVDRTRAKHESPIAGLARNLPLGDLLALGTQLRTDITPEMLLQDVADAISRVLGFTHVYVRLRNPETDALEACAFAGLSNETVARLRANTLAPALYQALLQPQHRISESYLVPDISQVMPELPGRSRNSQSNHLLLLVPLRGYGDRLIGAIYVDPADAPGTLDLSGVRVLEAIARQAALALENARLASRTQRLLIKEQLLAELGRDVSATLDLNTILAHTADRLQKAFQHCSLLLLNECGELEIVTSTGYDPAPNPSQHRITIASSNWVVEQGIPFLSNDLATENRIPALVSEAGDQQSGSQIAVPLRSGGRVIGALAVAADQVNSFTYEDVDLLEAVAAQIGGPISGAQLYQEAQRLAEQVRRRNEHLLVINALAKMAVSTLNIEQMLTTITNQLQEGFSLDHVELYRIDEEEQAFILVTHASLYERQIAGYRQPLNRGVLSRTYRTARTVRVDDVTQDPDYTFHPYDGSLNTRSELCVPIIAGGRVLAILNLESRKLNAFTDEDVAALETAADVLASAIENARLYQRAQEAAVLEERSRLARDLHDSISQQLFSMTLTAQAARAQLDKNPQRTASQLERIQETAAAALAEMRALIFQLRPPGLAEQGLVAALQQHVVSLDRREGLNVKFQVDGEERHARGVEQAIYRIVQEALNNVVKHAGTCHVEVHLELLQERISLLISDDGRGFDPTMTINGGRHLGLISMRERAAELGGHLELRSEPGRGTEILVIVPRT